MKKIFTISFISLFVLLVPRFFALADGCCRCTSFANTIKEVTAAVSPDKDTCEAPAVHDPTLICLYFDNYIPQNNMACVSTSTPLITPATTTPKAKVNAIPGAIYLTNPIGTTDIPTIIGRIISMILSIVGTVTLLMLVYGGFLWLTSAGNDKKVAQGKAIIMWSAIGLAIIFLAYVFVKFFFEAIGA
ncbi:MAG: pilin [Patescibacteria group bacterium]|nr:pilin [Patescibacteria group bacterium]